MVNVVYYWMFDLSMFLVFLCNSIVFIDLFLTLRNPFQPKEQRAKYYYGTIVIIILVFLFFTAKDVRVIEQEEDLSGVVKMIFFGMGLALSLPTIACTIIVILRLNRPGTSK